MNTLIQSAHNIAIIYMTDSSDKTCLVCSGTGKLNDEPYVYGEPAPIELVNHVHKFSYSGGSGMNSNVIEAECSVSGCNTYGNLTITINRPIRTVFGEAGSNKASLSVSGERTDANGSSTVQTDVTDISQFNNITGLSLNEDQIVYSGEGETVYQESKIAPVNPGTYKAKITLNTEIAKKYIEELKKLSEESNVIDNINIMDISRFPDVLNIRVEEEAEETIKNEVIYSLNEAIKNFIDMREKEGAKIKQDLENRIKQIENIVEKISNISAGLVEEYIVKLEERIKELLKTDVVDQNRLAQEVVIYSDKCSVEEEITRLKSHISQFLNLLNSDVAIGKKLDFLIQEMNRETNTIGSKANNLDITNYVVDIKTELENIREQVQNIE